MNKVILSLILAITFTTNSMAEGTKLCNTIASESKLDDCQQTKKDLHPRFNPEQYQRDLECYITKKANLTQQEAQVFFPLFREMQTKQRALFKKPKHFDRKVFTDNNAAYEAILQFDEKELEIKKLQANYHKKFLKILPATKVLQCIHAEDEFNKKMMSKFAQSGRKH